MCDIWQVTRRDEITPEDVASWVPELRSLRVRRVVLSGGEALLHSRLWELCGLLRSEGIGITLVTTGLLLERDAESLVAYCDDVVVSLDGPRDIHNLIRRIPTAYDKLGRGVLAVRRADTEGVVRISGRCTVQRVNHCHLRATVQAARDLGLDGISFLAADVSSEAFNRPGGWGSERIHEVALDESELAALEAELDALEAEHDADFSNGYIAETPAKLRLRLYRHFAALLGHEDFVAPECNAPWVSSVIESDGSVRPCFFQPPLGNVRAAGSLEAVLNSAASIAWRGGLDIARNEICRRCVCSLSLRQHG
jgi:MoaA/NifB/PqqE/SkfB family radical SAM enzyme